jgi:ABC-type transport system involved in cytochrome c biogenesis permease component
MKTKNNKSFLSDVPSWMLSVLTVFGATIVLFCLGEGVGQFIKINEDIGGGIAYIIFDVMIALGCFFIVKLNPKSIWYVPLICNAVGIIAAIVEPTFWKTSLWMLICGGWVVSIIASFIGALVGRRSADRNTNALQ